jgi:hypothetical protein
MAVMSEIVKCDVCGGIYNQKYLSSHRRLAHERPKGLIAGRGDVERLEIIASMYAQLSDANKREVRERLALADTPAR